MLNLTKTTSCGRFTVTIVSHVNETDGPILIQDGARSLKNLSDLLNEASHTALALAVNLLEQAGKTATA